MRHLPPRRFQGRDRPSSEPTPVRHFLETAAIVVAPTSVLTSIMFYFGWVRTNEYAKFFGLDHSVLNFTVRDYLLRSLDPLSGPLTVLLLLGALAVLAHLTLLRWRKVTGVVIAVVGCLLLVPSAVPALGRIFLLESLARAAAALLITYGLWLTVGPERPWTPATRMGVGFGMGLAVLSLLNAAEQYAAAVGRTQALNTVATLESRRGVIVYAAKDLHLKGGGVGVTLLDGKESAYKFRYTGLRLLIRANNRWILLPHEWAARPDDYVVILPDNDQNRLEFTPGFD